MGLPLRVGSLGWSIPFVALIAGSRFRWCWTFQYRDRVMSRIARFVAIRLRSSMRWRTRHWWDLVLCGWNRGQSSLYPPAARLKIRFGESGLLRDTRSRQIARRDAGDVGLPCARVL